MHYYLYATFVLALAACTEKQPATSTPSAPPSPPAGPAAPAAQLASAARPDTAVARQRLALAQLPAALRPTGQLLEAWRWTDANGENVLVAARTVVADDDQVDEGRTVRLLVRQHVRPSGSTSAYQQLWQLQDAVSDCPLDLTLGLLPGSTHITDLDGNGRTETTLVYALGCRGGIDPAALKLIMREGAAKYALRGEAIQPLGGPTEMTRARRLAAGPVCCAEGIPDTAYQRLEGLYVTEKDFTNAPPAFLDFAQQQWRRWRTRADQGTEVP